MAGMLLTSCNKEQAISETTVDIFDPYEYLKQKELEVKASGVEYTIEHATLEEINAVMRENSLSEFTQEKIDEAKNMVQTRSNWDCISWVLFGDWNDSGVLNVSDLVDARNWMCDYSTHPTDPCTQASINTTTCVGSTICPIPLEAKKFAFLSEMHIGGGYNILDEADIVAGTYRVAGLISCN